QTYVKPEDDWIRIEKNHEPLVSDRDFEIVQRLLGMDTRTSPDQKQVSKTSFISKRSLQVNRSVRKNNAFFSL
ncbi:MAG: recombinase family protein, partial [Coprococcus comes]